MNVKARIEILLGDGGQLAVSASSQNQITNLGMLGAAMAVIQNQIQSKKAEQSSLIVPEASL